MYAWYWTAILFSHHPYVYIHRVRTYVRIYVGMHIYIYVRMCVCAYTYIRTYVIVVASLGVLQRIWTHFYLIDNEGEARVVN